MRYLELECTILKIWFCLLNVAACHRATMMAGGLINDLMDILIPSSGFHRERGVALGSPPEFGVIIG